MTRRAILTVSLLAIALVAGYLVMAWRAAQPVDEAERDELAERALVNLDTLQRELEADIAAKPRSDIEERLESPLGQALFRHCSEWSEFHDNHPDEEVRAHRDEACGEYRDYVRTGALPERAEDESG